MAIRCAHCKDYHDTVSQVRACAGLGGVAVAELPVSRPASPVDRFKALAAKLPDVDRAYYGISVIDLEKSSEPFYEFYSVDKPQNGRWKGWTFVRRQAGDDFWKISFDKSVAVLEAIAADPEKALAAYGHEIGRCGICHRTLTDPESIARGIGPVCAERL